VDTTNKFSGKANIYSKYRPGYPAEYINYLVSYNNLSPNKLIADIGSGTGILTKQLLDKKLKVIAVEPNDDMRLVAEKTLNDYTNFISKNGTAENTGIENESIDLMTVAQAFHWFDKSKFNLECKRILKPDANVALVWNSRDFSSQLIIENAQINKKLCPLFTGFSGGIEETPEIYERFFKDGKYDYQIFQYDFELDLDGFVGRNLSASYAPKDTDPSYKKYIEAITELFEKYKISNAITVPNITRSYIGKV
jgi:ubiquinone/menaquinone biosynthesis C-methylase UbiE